MWCDILEYSLEHNFGTELILYIGMWMGCENEWNYIYS